MSVSLIGVDKQVTFTFFRKYDSTKFKIELPTTYLRFLVTVFKTLLIIVIILCIFRNKPMR